VSGDRHPAGTAITVSVTKWGDRPHWAFTASYLGADAHGEWLGIPAGTHFARPGAEYVAPVSQVSLLPAAGGGWVATFHAHGGPVRVYVDVTTPARWDGATLHLTDLDLDVVRLLDDTVLVDDEDEFLEHRVTLGYPDDVVRTAESTCVWLVEAVRRGRAPFDDTPDRWLARV
jgi:hypothetical protein